MISTRCSLLIQGAHKAESLLLIQSVFLVLGMKTGDLHLKKFQVRGERVAVAGSDRWHDWRKSLSGGRARRINHIAELWPILL